ncbi:MAG: GtrA family protein [Candidatus Saccharibacteria bacterium]
MKQKITTNRLYKEFASPYFIKYVLIGLTGVAIDFVIYAILVKVFSVNFLYANIIAISCGIINNFFLNLFLNFKTKNKLLIRFISFYTVGLLGLLLSEVLLIAFTKLGIGQVFAKFLTLPFVLVFQFFLNKYVSFSQNVEKYFINVFSKTAKK